MRVGAFVFSPRQSSEDHCTKTKAQPFPVKHAVGMCEQKEVEANELRRRWQMDSAAKREGGIAFVSHVS